MERQNTAKNVPQTTNKTAEVHYASVEDFAEVIPASIGLPIESQQTKKLPQLNRGNILALQRTYGNRAVQRLIASKTADPKKTIQRVLPLPAVPKTNEKLSTDGKGTKFGTPKYDNLLDAAKDLETWTQNAVDEEKTDQDIKNAKAFVSGDKSNLKTIVNSVSLFWGYSEGDRRALLIQGQDQQDTTHKQVEAKLKNREATLKYYLLDVLWREVASSAVRRIKRNSEQVIKDLSTQMGNLAKTTNIDDVSNDKGEMKKYKEKILRTYQNDIKKQEKLAGAVTFEVAYKVAQGTIREDNQIINDYLFDKERIIKVAQEVKNKVENSQEAIVSKYSESLQRRHFKIKTLHGEIGSNKTMWDTTKRKYQTKLLAKTEKLKDADYDKNLFKAAKNLSGDKTTYVESEAKNAVEAFKTKAGEEVLALYKATKKTIGKKDNTQSRHSDKDKVENMTRKILKGEETNIDIYDAVGMKETKLATDVIKTAQEKSLKESLEGPIHSRMRYIGSLVEPLVPMDGDKAKLEFTLKVPVGDPTGGAYVGMRLLGQVEHELEYEEEKTHRPQETFLRRTEDKEGKNKLKANTFKVKADLAFVSGWRVPFVADVGGELGGYLEVETDNVRDGNARKEGGLGRAMELVSFGFYRRARESTVFPGILTDALWGLGGESIESGSSFSEKRKAKNEESTAWGNAFQESFSDKDLVETGGFGAATGSASISGIASFKGGLRGYRGKRYTKQTMEALKRNKAGKQKKLTDRGSNRERNIGRNMNGTELSFEFNVGPFAAGGKIKLSWLDNQAGSQLDKDLTEKADGLKEELIYLSNPFATEGVIKNLKALSSSDFKAQVMDGLDDSLEDVNGKKAKDIKTDLIKTLGDRRLLKRQMFSVETEASAASKGGNLGNPSQIAAEAIKWIAEAGAKIRTLITTFQDQYGKDHKGKNIGNAFFSSAITGITSGVNPVNYDAVAIADKLAKSEKLINSQMSGGVGKAFNQTALDKMKDFAVKNTSGLKITLKHSTKRDFASKDIGAKFSKNYPTKFEVIFDQVAGGNLGSQIAVLSVEKATRLFRFGVKYKDGNTSLMTM
jgi:hypothetical protein